MPLLVFGSCLHATPSPSRPRSPADWNRWQRPSDASGGDPKTTWDPADAAQVEYWFVKLALDGNARRPRWRRSVAVVY